MTPPLLVVDGLHVDIIRNKRTCAILRGVSLRIEAGRIHGLVGESGAGKSMTGRAITQLLPAAARVSGRIEFNGAPVNALRGRKLRELRARSIATIFQDPAAHLNPLLRIGDYMNEALITIGGVSRTEANKRSASLLGEVGVEDPDRVLRQYPHQLSGGLLQRVMIGGALSMDPQLLIADEPTTALDVTTQRDVMSLLERLRRERGLAVLLVTHDLALAANLCDDVSVLYAGEVLERANARDIYERALSPYTASLLAARPDPSRRADRLPAISGRPLTAEEARPHQCCFADRCQRAISACREGAIPLRTNGLREVRCIRAEMDGEDITVGCAEAGRSA
jgi:oligopeptide/dipeptide ABC transporter ATP-binding protein